MKKIVTATAMLTLSALMGWAQSDVDALRYSRTFIGGTARYISMGGAFGALGADFSTASTNPAGLGLYKRSEFTITPSVFIGKTTSDFYGNKTYDSRSNFNLGNAGYVYASPPKAHGTSFLKNFQFSFGVNRSNNFNNRMLAQSYNDQNSIVDTYVDNATGIFYGDIEDNRYGAYGFDLLPAWNSYMIDTLPGTVDQYFGAVPPGGGMVQRQELNTWGSMNDLLFAFSGNFNDRMYMGVTFSFPFIRYFEESYYSEFDEEDNISGIDQLSVFESLNTRGTGFNLKLGTIIRVTNFIRIGGAFHSPTWFFNMQDEWYTEYTTVFDNNDSFRELSPLGNYDYELETPWKALGSVSFILWRMALISAEYEYTDFSKSKLRSSGYNFYDENTAIQQKYTETHTLRAGAEVRMKHVAIRAGGGYSTSPYNEGINDGERYYFSGGIGFRDRNYFVDLAYLQSFSNEDYYAYGSENVVFAPIANEYTTFNVLMTLGLRF